MIASRVPTTWACCIVAGWIHIVEVWPMLASDSRHDDYRSGSLMMGSVQEFVPRERPTSSGEHSMLSRTVRLASPRSRRRRRTTSTQRGSFHTGSPFFEHLAARLAVGDVMAGASSMLGTQNGTAPAVAAVNYINTSSAPPLRDRYSKLLDITSGDEYFRSAQFGSKIRASVGSSSSEVSSGKGENLSNTGISVETSPALGPERIGHLPGTSNFSRWMVIPILPKAVFFQLSHSGVGARLFEILIIIVVLVALSSVLAGFIYNAVELLLHETIWHAPPPSTIDEDVAVVAIHERLKHDAGHGQDLRVENG